MRFLLGLSILALVLSVAVPAVRRAPEPASRPASGAEPWLVPRAEAAGAARAGDEAQVDDAAQAAATDSPYLFDLPRVPEGFAESEPPRAFSWAESLHDMGAVEPPAQPGIDGWQEGPTNTLYRAVPSFTGDPTYEVLVLAPTSGHASRAERFLLQFPGDLLERPLEERALLVGLHGFAQTEKSIFLNTELPWECSARGWILVAPYGLSDTHFANVRSQAALEACVRVVYGAMPFNHRRVYAVGFSMGGLAALSFGMRHLDPRGLRFAAIAVHTAPLDLFQAWKLSSPPLQERLADDDHFGGTPTGSPFAWERVTPVRFLESGLVDAEHAPVDNLLHVPVMLHANLEDPLPHLVEGTQELKNHLLLRGATVEESFVFQPDGGHKWRTMDFAATVDFLAQHSLGGLPDDATLWCDRADAFLAAEVRAMPKDTHARYRLSVQPSQVAHTNAFALRATRELDELAVDVRALGLDPTAPLAFLHESADGTHDVIVLRGYETAPSSVSVEGVPPRLLEHDPETGELRVAPTSSGRAVRVDVVP